MSEAVVARARRCIGVRFRPQGRDPRHGLDCAGLAAVAAGVRGIAARYPMRGGDPDAIRAAIGAAGGVVVDPAEAGAGCLLLVLAGPAQFHLVVRTGAGFVHADAGIGRVVEVPGAPPWPVIAAWSIGEG